MGALRRAWATRGAESAKKRAQSCEQNAYALVRSGVRDASVGRWRLGCGRRGSLAGRLGALPLIGWHGQVIRQDDLATEVWITEVRAVTRFAAQGFSVRGIKAFG